MFFPSSLFYWQANQRTVKLSPIDVSIPDISRENSARNRNLDGQKWFDDKESYLLHIHAVELRNHTGGKGLALQHHIKTLAVFEHDVECQFERTRVFAANQFRELPKFALSSGI